MTKDELTEACAAVGYTFDELPPSKDAQGRTIIVCSARARDGYTLGSGYQVDLSPQTTDLCRGMAYKAILEGVIARATS